MGAVCGNSVVVGEGRPAGAALDGIKKLVGTGKLSSGGKICVHHLPCEVVQGQGARKACDLHITEAVVREAGLPDLRPLSLSV